MKFCIPTNWQEEILQELPVLNKNAEITHVYGKLALDEIGGGRPASALAFVSRKEAGRQIKAFCGLGLKFNYLINSLCMDNMEFTSIGQRRMRHLCEWLLRAGVDSVTVASPYVALWLKKNYPDLSLAVSVIAHVDSLKRAQFWEDLGADTITFPGPVVNRNFDLIKRLRKSLKCRIQLIANNPCLRNCPTSAHHHAMLSHASQSWHSSGGYVFDYYVIMCRCKRLEEPVNFIRSDWIRPEDISLYEDLGVDSIKLVDRRAPADVIIRAAHAYISRRYDGNLMDLFPTFLGKTFNAHRGGLRKAGFLVKVLLMNPVKVMKLSRFLSRLDVFIDNRKLDGFLEGIPVSCPFSSCQECGYCKAASDRAVKLDAAYQKDMIRHYQKAIDMISQDSFSLGEN